MGSILVFALIISTVAIQSCNCSSISEKLESAKQMADVAQETLKNEGKQFAKEAIQAAKACVKGIGGAKCTQKIDDLREHAKDAKETLKAGAEMLKEKALENKN